MRSIEYLNGIAGVAPGGVATLLCPVNRRYHSIRTFATALKGAQLDTPTTDPEDIIESVKQIVNGTVIRELTVQEYLDIAELNTGTRPTDNIPFFYSEPWRASIIGEEASSWDMAGQRTFVLEFKFKENIANPVVSILASYDNLRNQDGNGADFLSITRQKSFTYNVPQGDYDIVTLPIGNPIQRIHIRPSAGGVNRAKVVRDDLLVFEASKNENDQFLSDYGIDTPFGYTIAFDKTQQITDPLIVRRSLQVRANFSASNSAKVIMETIATGYR